MTEMTHQEFLEVMKIVAIRGFLRFKRAGQHYLAPVDEMWIGDTGKCVIVTPDMYVRSGTNGSWVEIPDNSPTHLIYNWLASTFHWVSDPDAQNGKLCIRTDEGPIYILLQGEEVAAEI